MRDAARRIAVFSALVAWCGALLVLRIARSDTYLYWFLIWNLFLAAIPFVAGLAIEALDRRRGLIPLQWMAFVVWLLFVPNAPYIFTDFIHLAQRPGIPLWYDVLLLASFAGTGLLLGYASVLSVHRIVEDRFGVVTGWLVAVSALVLSAFGIYIGRFLRWNSWDAVTEPLPLVADIAKSVTSPADDPKSIAVTVLFGIALTLGYLALHVLAESAADRRLEKVAARTEG